MTSHEAIVGRRVAVRRTGAYGTITWYYDGVVEVALDTGRTVRFDRSSLEVVPVGTGRQVTK